MSTQIIKQTSESVAPKASKAQIIEALTLQEHKERFDYNEKLKEKRKIIDKEINKICISHLTNKSKEELPKCEFYGSHGEEIRLLVTIEDSKILSLIKERSKIGLGKSINIDDIKKEIRVLVNEQVNIKENPLLKEENTDKVKLLLSLLKNPQQQTIELK